MLIPLTKNKFAIIDDKDCELVSGYSWQENHGYARTAIYHDKSQRYIYMHRLIMECPESLEVDHINNNKLDNRWTNLRLCSRSENVRNVHKRKDSLLRYRGIIKARNRFKARIQIEGKRICSLSFKTQEEAAKEYNRLAKLHHKEFASLNII